MTRFGATQPFIGQGPTLSDKYPRFRKTAGRRRMPPRDDFRVIIKLPERDGAGGINGLRTADGQVLLRFVDSMATEGGVCLAFPDQDTFIQFLKQLVKLVE
jgi:hypothetical protein